MLQTRVVGKNYNNCTNYTTFILNCPYSIVMQYMYTIRNKSLLNYIIKHN